MPTLDKKAFLKQLTKELHKPVTRRFQRAKVITAGIDDVWACDLVDMQQFADENDGVKYMLNCVDAFSRYAFSHTLKDKTGDSVLKAFKAIIASSGRKPKRLWVDQGKEFINKKMKAWLEENISIYHTFGEHKASIVERFNRTLKSLMWRKFTENQDNRWIEMLPELIRTYNSTRHSAIRMTPTEASKRKNERKLWKFQYKDATDTREIEREVHPKLHLGDWVRISKLKRTFEKGYTPNWSLELFKVVAIRITDPPTYTLQDFDGERIKGSFYEEELQKSKLGDIFLVDEILQRKTVKGKRWCW